MASSTLLPRSLRSRESVKDVWRHFVKDVMRLHTSFAMSGFLRPEPAPVWQKRFYDFNVWTEDKHIEKLRYMHRTPVKRGLVDRPEQWKWSSFCSYLFGETGPVRVRFQELPLEIRSRPVVTFGEAKTASLVFVRGGPLIRKERE
jgi:hypothetical protein